MIIFDEHFFFRTNAPKGIDTGYSIRCSPSVIDLTLGGALSWFLYRHYMIILVSVIKLCGFDITVRLSNYSPYNCNSADIIDHSNLLDSSLQTDGAFSFNAMSLRFFKFQYLWSTKLWN